MRGRKPTPTHLRVIRGNPSRRPLPKNEPQPRGALLVAPAYLTEPQKIIWAKIIAVAAPGLLRACDEFAVASLAQHLAAAVEANKLLAESGSLLVKSSSGPVPNPYLRIRRQELERAHALMAELGFTPASRSRIELTPDVQPDDDWEGLLDP
jgi:P27 family predicted phage terminase small subunit